MRRLLAPETVLPTTPPLPTPAPILAPLPDGTMPLTPPPMPTPILPNANTLLEQFNLPSPAQLPELLKRMGETTDLKDSEKLAMQQKIVMADFEKSLAALIAKQRNPNVPNMTLSDAVQIALKQNPDILNCHPAGSLDPRPARHGGRTGDASTANQLGVQSAAGGSRN
jgi:hypothetical protein